MAKRPIRRKQANRLRKALRTQLPAFIDLVDYLKTHGFADTTGQAERIILAGRVRSESHKLGIGEGRRLKDSARIKVAMGRLPDDSDFETVPVVDRCVPAKMRATLQVLPS